MNMRRKTILWLDDDFDQDKARISMWIKFFEKNTDKFRLIAVGSLKDFARELENRCNVNIQEEDFIDSILLDVMMRTKRNHANFEQFDLNFANINWKALEAGIQILQMMQEPIYYARQPEWLHPYRERKIILLTSNTQVNTALNGITPEVKNRTEVLIKDSDITLFAERLKNL